MSRGVLRHFPGERPAGIRSIRLLAQRNWTTHSLYHTLPHVKTHSKAIYIDISGTHVYSDLSAMTPYLRCGSTTFGISTCNTLERCGSSRRFQKNFN
jgi:hypothetical protein